MAEELDDGFQIEDEFVAHSDSEGDNGADALSGDEVIDCLYLLTVACVVLR
jgi:hypothetical protein